MSYRLIVRQSSRKSVKRLKKRYRNVTSDVAVAFDSILADPQLGTVIPRDFAIRKLRVASRDMRRGKSGGYRLLYLLKDKSDETWIYALELYAKSERDDVTQPELKDLLEGIEDDEG